MVDTALLAESESKLKTTLITKKKKIEEQGRNWMWNSQNVWLIAENMCVFYKKKLII